MLFTLQGIYYLQREFLATLRFITASVILGLVLGDGNGVLACVIRVVRVAHLEIDRPTGSGHREGVIMTRVVARESGKIRGVFVIDPQYPAAWVARRCGRGSSCTGVSIERVRPLGLRGLPNATDRNGDQPLVRILCLRPIGVRKIHHKAF